MEVVSQSSETFKVRNYYFSCVYCDLRSSLRRAVSKRTFYVSKRAFAVSKRTFAVSNKTVLTGLMLSLNNEIDTLSRFERNVWVL